MAKYGVWDTKNNVWMGNAQGPLLFDDDGTCPGGKIAPGNAKDMAEITARILDVKLKQPAGQCRERVFAEKSVVYKDDVPAHRSTEEALDMLEKGETL